MDRSLLASCLLTATMCGAAPAAAQVAGSLVLAPCRLEHPRGLSSVAARSARFSVAENPDEPDGRHIELAVADCDLLIGAVLVPNAKAPTVVTKEMIKGRQF